MHWALEFYKKQNEWIGVFRGEPGELERGKVKKIREKAGEPPLEVLELGSGGGQFAISCAEEGYRVLAIELVPQLTDHIRELGKHLEPDQLQVINGDFYEVEIENRFNVICYWDGFGIGEDSDQRILLKKITSWLKPDGLVFLDIYAPWFWAREAGPKKDFGNFIRQTDFDFKNCRFLDSIWPKNNKEETITQSLRCYTPSDLELLLEGTGLEIQEIDEVAGLDGGTGEYSNRVKFEDAMMYTVTLKQK